jgi:hypothetical protein
LAHASADLTVKLLLVDTNIVSYFHRGDTRAKRYEPHLMGKQLFVSFMTVAELYKWPLERNWSEQNKQAPVQFLTLVSDLAEQSEHGLSFPVEQDDYGSEGCLFESRRVRRTSDPEFSAGHFWSPRSVN